VRSQGKELVNGYTQPDGTFCASNVGGVPSQYDASYDKPGYGTEQRSVSNGAGHLPAVCLMVPDAGRDGG
jgi:hypothetical protein